jgi:hypothetical protein
VLCLRRDEVEEVDGQAVLTDRLRAAAPLHESELTDLPICLQVVEPAGVPCPDRQALDAFLWLKDFGKATTISTAWTMTLI